MGTFVSAIRQPLPGTDFLMSFMKAIFAVLLYKGVILLASPSTSELRGLPLSYVTSHYPLSSSSPSKLWSLSQNSGRHPSS